MPIERTSKRLADRYDRLHVCFEPDQRDMGFIAKSKRSATMHGCRPGSDPETVGRADQNESTDAVTAASAAMRARGPTPPTRLCAICPRPRGALTIFVASASVAFLSAAHSLIYSGGGHWTMRIGAAANQKFDMPRSRSSFRKGSTRSKMRFNACVASRNSSPLVPEWSMRRSWKPTRRCAAPRFSSL